MKLQAPIAIITTALLLPLPATAQEHPGCFWVNPSGQMVSLASLCGNTPVTVAAPQVSAEPAEDMRPIAYADAYCRARRAGYPEDVARQRAAAVAIDQDIRQHGGDAAAAFAQGIGLDVISAAIDRVSLLCPEFE